MLNSVAYKYSPIFIQNLLLSCHELIKRKLRATKSSNALMQQLISHEKDSKALEEYSKNKLESVINNAINNTEYYSKYKNKKNLNISDFSYTSKEDVRKHTNQFINCKSKEIKISGQTSGTTGKSLTIYQDISSVRAEKAFTDRHLQWAGFKKGDKIAWLRGDKIVPMQQKKPPYWRFSYFNNMIFFSAFHMTKEVIPMYIKAMEDNKVDIIQAAPSSVVTLAKYLEMNDTYYQGKLKSIVTSSESLSLEHKLLIEKHFKCTVFDWYGLFERVAAIASCEHNNYHILTDYSHVELLEEDNGYHEIVGTNFNNRIHPLIRYRTGDYVALSNKKNCPCGRVYPIIDHIKGRRGDYLIAEDGQKVYHLSQITKAIPGIIAAQFLQDSQTKIKLLLVVDENKFDSFQKTKLINSAKKDLGASLEIEIELVDIIPKTKNGKTRQVICNIKG
ncbi:phenylacetate--CoA ligase family protein [Motilimonas sp. E26]|uniref:phenylacetate--CoA ligase family protein n=1 Tax=Motilimonas sp. E26 TaxID=2865674 RepID=UPI001E39084B|nr:phenylacetate--CoA ligase family protein [Motilimonas sp. E26]MCE0557337.1 phenylacetate--CoA ligase family protein [Motilimonas sp. E26]